MVRYVFTDLLCDSVQLLGLFDHHFDFLLPLQHLFDVLAHLPLEALQLSHQGFLLVFLPTAVEEGLRLHLATNCCLKI